MNLRKVNLADCAAIRQGYQFRSKVRSDPDGTVPIVQMADIVEGRAVNWASLQTVSEDKMKPEHYLKEGDLLFCARGANNYSFVLDQVPCKNPVAVSQFLIVQTNREKLLPEYLAWYLAQKDALDYLKSNTLVSTVPLINKRTLEEMEIPLPPIETQNAIAKVYTLSLREERITRDLLRLKKRMIDAVMMKSLEGKVKHV